MNLFVFCAFLNSAFIPTKFEGKHLVCPQIRNFKPQHHRAAFSGRAPRMVEQNQEASAYKQDGHGDQQQGWTSFDGGVWFGRYADPESSVFGEYSPLLRFVERMMKREIDLSKEQLDFLSNQILSSQLPEELRTALLLEIELFQVQHQGSHKSTDLTDSLSYMLGKTAAIPTSSFTKYVLNNLSQPPSGLWSSITDLFASLGHQPTLVELLDHSNLTAEKLGVIKQKLTDRFLKKDASLENELLELDAYFAQPISGKLVSEHLMEDFIGFVYSYAKIRGLELGVFLYSLRYRDQSGSSLEIKSKLDQITDKYADKKIQQDKLSYILHDQQGGNSFRLKRLMRMLQIPYFTDGTPLSVSEILLVLISERRHIQGIKFSEEFFLKLTPEMQLYLGLVSDPESRFEINGTKPLGFMLADLDQTSLEWVLIDLRYGRKISVRDLKFRCILAATGFSVNSFSSYFYEYLSAGKLEDFQKLILNGIDFRSKFIESNVPQRVVATIFSAQLQTKLVSLLKYLAHKHANLLHPSGGNLQEYLNNATLPEENVSQHHLTTLAMKYDPALSDQSGYQATVTRLCQEKIPGTREQSLIGEPKSGDSVFVQGIALPLRKIQTSLGASIPSKEEAQLVITQNAAEVLEKLAGQWRTGSPALLEGPTSAGKTSYVKYLAYLTGSPYRRINLSLNTDVRDLLGRWVAGNPGYTLQHLQQMSDLDLKNLAEGFGLGEVAAIEKTDLVEQVYQVIQNPHWEDGPVVQAMRRGEVLLLDELNLAKPQVVEALNSLFDSGVLTLDDNGAEVVHMHPETKIFATMNPSFYSGRQPISDAFKSRCAKVWIEAPSQQDLSQILASKYPDVLSEEQLASLIASHIQIVGAVERGIIGHSDVEVNFSLRNLFRVLDRVSYFSSFSSLPKPKLLRREFEEIYLNALKDEGERKIVKEILSQSMPFGIQQSLGSLQFVVAEDSFTIGDLRVERYPESDHPLIPRLEDLTMVMTDRTKASLYRLVKALQAGGEHVALVGERASGKTAMVEYYAALKRQPFYRQIFSEKTDNMELVGMFSPSGWQDGQIVRAGRPAQVPGIFLADEFNQANDAVQERLNSLLDKDRKLVLAERGGEEVKFDPGFRFVAAFNPVKMQYAGRRPLSMAMQNRLSVQYVPDLDDKQEFLQIFAQIAKSEGIPEQVMKTLVELHFWVKENYKSGVLADSKVFQGEVFSIRQLLFATKALSALVSDAGSYKEVFKWVAEMYYQSVFENNHAAELIGEQVERFLE